MEGVVKRAGQTALKQEEGGMGVGLVGFPSPNGAASIQENCVCEFSTPSFVKVPRV